MDICIYWIFVFLAFLDVFTQNAEAKIVETEDCPRSKIISTFYPCHRSDGRTDRCVRKRCCAGYQYVNGHCVPEELDVCADTPCEQQCTNNFGRVLCTCYSGFLFDKTKYRAGLSPYCVDLDECRFRNGGCEQLCINTIGSYRCACNDGFKVAGDGRSCIETPILKSTEQEEEVCHASCRNFTFLQTVVQDVEKKVLLFIQKDNTKQMSFKEGPKIEHVPNQFKGLPGTPGERGPQGAKGETGSRGLPGPAGPAGPKGIPGSRGLPGPVGLRGQKGAMGFPGIEGKRGYRGDRGYRGPIGDPGIKGERGDKGSDGVPGERGLKGRIGPPGVPGLPGIPGRSPTFSMTPKIKEGKRGKRGSQGRTGPPGKPGQKGETGIPGPRGPKGESAVGEAILNMIANMRRDIVELQQRLLGKTPSFNTMIPGNDLGNTLLTTDDEDLAGSGRKPDNPP